LAKIQRIVSSFVVGCGEIVLKFSERWVVSWYAR